MKFKIAEESFFNNGELLLSALRDSAGNPLFEKMHKWLEQDFALDYMERKDGRMGVAADDLNKALRQKMNIIHGIHGETHMEYNGFLHKGIEGFDFSLYDEDYNIVQIRNTLIGNPGQLNGSETLEFLYTKTDYSRSEWLERIGPFLVPLGENIELSKKTLTIVGELQFGNWALSNHDLLRLLNTSECIDVDYYIYVTATGTLERMLSTGIVTFDKINSVVIENKRIIRTPMWIIGLDID